MTNMNYQNNMENPKISVNQRIEEQYALFQGVLKAEEQRGTLRQWFVDYTNRDKQFQPLNVSDICNLELVTEGKALRALRTRYSYDYKRPIFRLPSPREFCTFYNKSFGGRARCGGMIIKGADTSDLTRNLRIIVIDGGSDKAVDHELRHSIDTNLYKRQETDSILNEFIAYFGELLRDHEARENNPWWGLVEPAIKNKIPPIRNVWDIKNRLKRGRIYYHQCCPDMPLEEYNETVDTITETLNNLSKTYPLNEIDRILFACLTINQLKEHAA